MTDKANQTPSPSDLPGVDEFLRLVEGCCAPLALKKKVIRGLIDSLRGRILAGEDVAAADLEPAALVRSFDAALTRAERPCFRRVINATGVVVHTNLGRSVLPDTALEMIAMVGGGYSNLEFDLDTGRRGSRYSLVADLVCEITGAEAALVVNNNAAAVMLCLDTLARGREVIVSRGQLVEIGGSFRIPDVMSRTGAILKEVGATNRTHLRDYEAAISENTAMLLKVHTSNYRIIGFASEVAGTELAALAHRHGLPVMEDLGSGCIVDLSRYGLTREPTVREVVESGVDLVTFSGDKLLGGPQAGIIVGRRDLVEEIRKNPMNRALRIDKFTLAGLEAVFRLYQDEVEAVRRIPTLAMLACSADELKKRARRLARRLAAAEIPAETRVVPTVSRVGGGALPDQDLAGYAVTVRPERMTVAELERRLRRLDTPVIARIEEGRLLLDVRTVADGEVRELAAALAAALGGTE